MNGIDYGTPRPVCDRTGPLTDTSPNPPMYAQLVRLFFFAVATCGIAACGVDVSAPSNAVAAGNAVDRAHHFVESSRAMLSLGPDYWARVVSQLYYAALQLGRLKDATLLLERRESYHKAVWRLAPIKYRDFFGGTLKRSRAAADYDLSKTANSTGREELALLARADKSAFRLLLEDSRANLDAHFKRCTSSPPCSICAGLTEPGCLKERSQERLAALAESINGILARDIPAQIDGAGNIASRLNDSAAFGSHEM